MKKCVMLFFSLILLIVSCGQKESARQTVNFGADWHFFLGDVDNAESPEFNETDWRLLNVPHDWSIEGEFSEEHPAGAGGGALPGGIGWYRKTFSLPETDAAKLVFIHFDGVYMNSDVWINGHFLGHRPYGYISFRYELTPYLNYGDTDNVIAVRVDNSLQPNSRWYSGCGIYRNVWLVHTSPVHINNWGTFVTTPEVTSESAIVNIKTTISNSSKEAQKIVLKSTALTAEGSKVAEHVSEQHIEADEQFEFSHDLNIQNPKLWSVDSPTLYSIHSDVFVDGKLVDDVKTPFGIRTFHFDVEKGFSLNGKPMKILGVCQHHDLGCLGSAINRRALERQLEILKEMGCNAIRTSHNPPAPELLDLCDQMGFIVMDEAFDMWKMPKTTYDYSLYYDEWHERDLIDFIKRDRNHPSVMIWSIGNEIPEQWDESGVDMARELAGIVRDLDATRPITSGCNFPEPSNSIIQSGELDLIGYNYHHQMFEQFPHDFPGEKFIGAETGSALATRGAYDMPSDSVRIWPKDWRKPEKYNDDYTCSSYDNCRVGWGSTHTDTWDLIKKHDFLSGMFYWTGFDYLGEPTPYSWPARSSYFGIIDLAGFPKDAYYFYQAEWTDKPVLHLFPHWNWQAGDVIDVWAYTNCARVELFLNDVSLGVQENADDIFHLSWRVDFQPGVLKAVGQKDGVTLTTEIATAAESAKIELAADRNHINADGQDLSFVTVKILDADGNLVPRADNLVQFDINGPGFIAGVDNGHQISHEPFKANYRKAFNGLCLAVIQSTGEPGDITLSASSDGLESAVVEIHAK